jgi:exopolysaccharide biosynthesis polyprenyl glycosylphosphotransferase
VSVLTHRAATASLAELSERSTPIPVTRTTHPSEGGMCVEERRYVQRLRWTDGAVALTAGLASYLVRFGDVGEIVTSYLVISIAAPALWLLLVAVARAYEPRFLHVGTDEFRRILHAGAILTVVAATVSYALKLEFSRGYLLALVLLVTAGTLLTRFVARRQLYRQRVSGAGWMRRVVVAGQADDVDGVLAELGRGRFHGYEVAGVCVADASGHSYDAPVTVGLHDVADAARRHDADAVIVLPCRELGGAALRRLGWRLEQTGTNLLVAPGLLDVARQRATVSSVGSLPILHVHHAELTGVRRVAKEVLERAAAAIGLLLVSPLLLLLALLIRLDGPGPVIFRQERVGRGFRPFVVYKLRTMSADADSRQAELAELNESDGALFKMRSDPRVTRVGGFLRRFSLDELPQLVNVVRGEMSLIGPRPPLPSEVMAYEPDVLRRLVVKPGLTGLWQVSGRSDLPWDEAVRLDLRYVDNWTLLMDMSILWKTGRAVLSRSGAY